MLRVRDDADNRARRIGVVAWCEADALPDGAAPREPAARERLVDDDHRHGVLTVGRLEGAALHRRWEVGSKSPGVMTRYAAPGSWPGRGTGRPSTRYRNVRRSPAIGRWLMAPAAVTPGSAAMR